MKLIWYGHSCFKVICENGTVVFDPYAPGSVPGLEPIAHRSGSSFPGTSPK